MRKYFRIEIITNVLAAIGALAISAVNTNRVMSSAGIIMGWAAVFALEIGLAGLVLRITKDTPTKPKGILAKLWTAVLQYGSPFLVVLILIATNVLARVDLIGFGLSEVVYDIIQLIVLGAFIPFLALMNLHAARDAIQRVSESSQEVVTQPVTKVEDNKVEVPVEEPVVKEPITKKPPRKKHDGKPTAEERRAAIRKILENGQEIENKSELARQFGVKYQTIYTDIKAIEEEGFSSF